MPIDLSKYGNWNSLLNSLAYTAPNSDNGTIGGYSQNGVNWTPLYGDNPMGSSGNPNEGALSGFFVPSSADGSGYNTVLSRNADGSIGQQQTAAHVNNSLLDKLLMLTAVAGMGYLAAPAAAGGGAAAGAGAAEGAGTAAGAAEAGTAAGAAGGTAAGGTAAGGASLGSGVSLGAGGTTGVTGSFGAGGLTASGSGLGLTTAGTSSGALGSLGSGYFGAETAAGMGGAAAGGALGTSGASTATGSSASGAGEAAAPTTSTGGQVSFSDAGYDAQNGISPDWTGSGSASTNYLDSVPDWLKSYATNKAVGTATGALLGKLSGNGMPNNLTTTTQSQIDPRMAPYIYGDNGLLSGVASAVGTPQSAGMQNFGNAATNFLGSTGQQSINNIYAASNGLMNGGIYAPTTGAAAVNAPSQNGTNLAPAYQDMIYGAPGANPYLTGAIQKGINQSNNAFGNMMTDATRNLNENVLPSIRSGAIVNGSMGSSRQGIAEGRALNDYSTQLGRAMSQFGQNNTDAAVAAQAGAYDADRTRALSAMSGLGAQQYGVATQNAQLQQQANLANLQSQLGTNQLNSSREEAGINANRGLLSDVNAYGANQDSYGLNKLGKVSGLLQPYTGLNSSSTNSQPLYQNTAGNIMGGALLGSQLFGSNKS